MKADSIYLLTNQFTTETRRHKEDQPGDGKNSVPLCLCGQKIPTLPEVSKENGDKTRRTTNLKGGRNNLMHWISVPVLLLIFLLTASTAFAQKRARTSKGKTTSRPRTTAEPTAPPQITLIKEANATAEQLKLLSSFLYLYGRISNGLETAEAQARRGELNRTLLEKHKQNKTRLAESIRNLKGGIDTLLLTLQAHPKLQQQYSLLLVAPETILAAEQLALDGKFDDAGRSLVKVAEILTEVLAEIR